MKKGCLIAIIIMVVILGLLIIGPIIWVNLNKDKIKAEYSVVREEAKKFAESSTSEGCLQESLLRVTKFKSLSSYGQNRGFFWECLKCAEYTPGFCDDIPEKAGFKEFTWANQKCKNSPNSGECIQLWNLVIQFCSARK